MRRGKKTLNRRGTVARTRQQAEESKQNDPVLLDPKLLDPTAHEGQQPEEPQLTEEELEANIERTLSASNPQAAQNYAYYSFKDRMFRREDTTDQMAIHLSLNGGLLLKDTDEAMEQDEFVTFKKREADGLLHASSVEEGFPTPLDHETQLRSLRNQFNYAERTAQSVSYSIKERGVSTEPPPTQNFSGGVNMWEIYDKYVVDLNLRRAAPAAETTKTSKPRRRGKTSQSNPYSAEMTKAIKIMERMVNQNASQFYYNTYKYVDNFSDQTNLHQGSLTKLWTFASEKTKKKEVTALAWNPKYTDLFAVGYGNYGFMKKTSGLICCYSLKNVQFPEYYFTTHEGVMCLDWHPEHPALLAVGLYDGTVLVFDVRSPQRKPLYQSTVRTNKHTDPVWEVRWQEVDPLKNLSFFSISTDGRVTNWVLMKNKLEPEEVIRLKLVSGQGEGDDDEAALSGLAGGTCFDFNPFHTHLFLVGTEEGKVHKCNKTYNAQYMDTYNAHFMAVYAVKWNRFHPDIFLSSSADWTVKMWDHNDHNPLLTFDLGVAVGDIAWAPYSSSVFAAVDSAAKCYVYDLEVNKLSDVCDCKLPAGQLNHVAFNPSEPILLIGNDKGTVTSFKLSTNLRRHEELTEEEQEAGETLDRKERKKMDRILDTIDRKIY